MIRPSVISILVLTWLTVSPSSGQVLDATQISSVFGLSNEILVSGAEFGRSVISLGDLDGNGFQDIAVGAPDTGAGDLWILFLDSDDRVNRKLKISRETEALATELNPGDRFGHALANLGDLDGDGNTEVAVGAINAVVDSSQTGAVWIISLSNEGDVTRVKKIAGFECANAQRLSEFDSFGYAITSLGDVNGDGVPDLAISAPEDDDGGEGRGAVWVFFLENDEQIFGQCQKISSLEGDFEGALDNRDRFGSSLAVIGDIDRDSYIELAVGAREDDDNTSGFGANYGAVWILSINDNGVVHKLRKISAASGGFEETLRSGDRFGQAMTALADIDGDGINELAVSTAGTNRQVGGNSDTYILTLNPESDSLSDDIVETDVLLNITSADFENLRIGDNLGTSLAYLGIDPETEHRKLAVGASGDDGSGQNKGAVWIMDIDAESNVTSASELSETEGGLFENLDDLDFFGSAITTVDLNGDGREELAVGANGDGTSTRQNTGSVRILFLNPDSFHETDTPILNTVKNDNFSLRNTLKDDDFFGTSIANLGDIDGDNIPDLAVGAPNDDDGGEDSGAVWILFMRSDGTVREYRKISSLEDSLNEIEVNATFGTALTALGDLDGNGYPELAVGAPLDFNSGFQRGAVWILFLGQDGVILDAVKLDNSEQTFAEQLDEADLFGASLASVDLNNDGISELVVGATNADEGGLNTGSVWIFFIDSAGIIERSTKISKTSTDLLADIEEGHGLGGSLSSLLDLNNDRVPDLAIGSDSRNIIWIMLMQRNGAVKDVITISRTDLTDFGEVNNDDKFGSALAALSDFDNDGIPELVAGAKGTNIIDGRTDRGAIWIMSLNLSPSIATPSITTSTNDPLDFDDSSIPITSVNEKIKLRAEITDNTPPVKLAQVHFKSGGDSNFLTTQLSVSPLNDNVYEFEFPESIITDQGLAYYVTASDSSDFASATDTFSVRTRPGASGASNSVAQPIADNTNEAYRLVSFPLELDQKSPADVLEDDLGSYDPKTWRFFGLQLQDQSYIDFPAIDEIEPGHAYWLFVTESDRFLDTGSGISYPITKSFSISLEPGWNLIGNPFTFPIPQQQVRLASGAVPRFRHYPDTWDGDHYAGALIPFEGYAIHSMSVDTLLIDPNLADQSPNNSVAATSKPEWSLQISASVTEQIKNTARLGILEQASNRYDRLDIPESMPIGRYVSVYFENTDWGTTTSRFTSDWRPSIGDSASWNLAVSTNTRSFVQLDFSGLDSIADYYSVTLLDKALGIARNLKEKAVYMVAGAGESEPRRLQILIKNTTSGAVASQDPTALPKSFALHQNFPNPFQRSTTIPYDVPFRANINLTVFDIMGKEVVRIEHNSASEAGRHAALWDGRNAAGEPVASGVYFIRMKANSFEQTRKIVLLN